MPVTPRAIALVKHLLLERQFQVRRAKLVATDVRRIRASKRSGMRPMNLLPGSAGVPPACCNRDLAGETPALPGVHWQALTKLDFREMSLLTSAATRSVDNQIHHLLGHDDDFLDGLACNE